MSAEMDYYKLAAHELAIKKLEVEQRGIPQQLAELNHQRAENEKIIKHTQFEWKYKRMGSINDIVYSAALLLSFSLMCCMLCPPGVIVPATALILSLAGAALCFIFTLVSASIASGIQISKLKATSQELRKDAGDLLAEFRSTADVNNQKRLYLEMKGLMANSAHQQRMARFQTIKLIHTIIIDALVPTLTFVSLVFMPLGIGLGVMAAGLVLALLSKWLLKRCEPEADKLPDLDLQTERSFQKFREDPDADLSHFETSEPKRSCFFPSSAKGKEEKPPADPGMAPGLVDPAAG